MTVSGWRLKGLLGAVALLLIGGIAGVTIDRALVRFHDGGHGGEEAHAHEVRHSLLATLRHELDLDDGQVAAIEAILNRHQARLEHAWQSVRPVMLTAADSAGLEIETVLRPEQIEPFRAWFRRHRAEAEERH